jgi:hypothetical protein
MSIRRQPSIALEQPVRDSLTKLGRSSEENADALPKQEGSLQSSGLTRSRVPALARRLLLIMLFKPFPLVAGNQHTEYQRPDWARTREAIYLLTVLTVLGTSAQRDCFVDKLLF